MTKEEAYEKLPEFCPICGDSSMYRLHNEVVRLKELLESSRQVAEQRRQKIIRLQEDKPWNYRDVGLDNA